MIDHMDDGVVFQIASPSGTMIVQHAQEFSENGQVKTGAMKINWAALRAEKRKADSIATVRENYRVSLLNELEKRHIGVDRKQDRIPELEEKLKSWKADSTWYATHPSNR